MRVNGYILIALIMIIALFVIGCADGSETQPPEDAEQDGVSDGDAIDDASITNFPSTMHGVGSAMER